MAELEVGSFEWFRDKVGLHADGLDVRRKFFEERKALVRECEALWGTRNGNIGFQLELCKDVEIVNRINALWPKVYQREWPRRKEVGLSFAIGIMAERKGLKVNWASFAATSQHYGHKAHKSLHTHPIQGGTSSPSSLPLDAAPSIGAHKSSPPTLPPDAAHEVGMHGGSPSTLPPSAALGHGVETRPPSFLPPVAAPTAGVPRKTFSTPPPSMECNINLVRRSPLPFAPRSFEGPCALKATDEDAFSWRGEKIRIAASIDATRLQVEQFEAQVLECEKELVGLQHKVAENSTNVGMAGLLVKTATSEEFRCRNEVEELKRYCAREVERARAQLEAFLDEGRDLDSELTSVNSKLLKTRSSIIDAKEGYNSNLLLYYVTDCKMARAASLADHFKQQVLTSTPPKGASTSHSQELHTAMEDPSLKADPKPDTQTPATQTRQKKKKSLAWEV